MPVSVMVSTVVVRSGTASARAAAFWIPIATASRAATASMKPDAGTWAGYRRQAQRAVGGRPPRRRPRR